MTAIWAISGGTKPVMVTDFTDIGDANRMGGIDDDIFCRFQHQETLLLNGGLSLAVD